METDIIVEGFKKSEAMHGLRYIYMIGDGDSSVYLSVTINVPYGLGVHKVECANHAIKCFRSGLEKITKENAGYSGKHGLTPARIQRICRGMKCAIRQHSSSNDVAALPHDLRNCPHHCFGDHKNCRSSFCKNAGKENEELFEMMPAGLIQAVDTLADRIVSKAAQLIRNKTTNLCENYMSIRCKMDGGKYFNRVQSGSFQHRCIAAALRVQCGPDWIAQVWR
ncbi:uncharacterized protein [Dysidea avara]|uniref:uncharacterized protein n=1 Tax=Dysidea avara TaxID=196820 RepID=UPI00332C5772